MDQDTAQHLFEAGAMLLFLDVPPGTEIGIDMHSWQTGEKFKGIKMIPPGLHFIYFSATNKTGQVAPRTGFFKCFQEKEICVRRWDPQLEMLGAEVTDTEELHRFCANKKEMDRFCGAYPYESYKKWVSLSQHISDEVVIKVQPKSGFILSATALESEPSDSASRAAQPKKEETPLNKMTADNLMPDMKEHEDTVMNYTKICRFLAGSDASMITKCATDTSMVIEDFVMRCQSWNNVLGELQLSFLCFLIGQQFDSFDQWKKLTALLCGNQSSIAKYEDMYAELVQILHFQLREMPEDFFVDIVSSINFLTVTLHDLFINISDSGASQQLKQKVQRFSQHLTKKFGWDFETEPDDCAPVVVDDIGNY